MMYKYVFGLPDELKKIVDLEPFLKASNQYVIYAESEKEARKFAKKRIKEEHNVRLKSKLKLIYRTRS